MDTRSMLGREGVLLVDFFAMDGKFNNADGDQQAVYIWIDATR